MRSSHKSIWFELGALLTLLALATLGVPSPHSSAQKPQANRQLNRDRATQPNRANERRLALIIGNGAYQNANPLKNPPNDAKAIADALRELGFEVTLGTNKPQREMKQMMREFGQRLRTQGGVGLFYYAGHGVQAKGHNYLIPVAAVIQSEADLEDEAIDVNYVLNLMDEAQNALNIVILDACRNNPFGRSFRSAQNGLAQVKAPTGTLIAYATAPDDIAADGGGANSPYTEELIKEMRLPGVLVETMFRRVAEQVSSRSGGRQEPWFSANVKGDFYFTNTTNSTLSNSPAKIDAVAVEREYWETVRSSNDPQDYKDYIQTYPTGAYAAIARAKIRQIETAKNTPGSNTVASLNPQLTFAGQESLQDQQGKNLIRYRISVTNHSAYPNEMFAPAPDLPPCGPNTKSSRTWVDIYDSAEKKLFLFCALKSSNELANLYFLIADGQPPPSDVFVVITDRQTKAQYKSALLAISLDAPKNTRPTDSQPTNTQPAVSDKTTASITAKNFRVLHIHGSIRTKSTLCSGNLTIKADGTMRYESDKVYDQYNLGDFHDFSFSCSEIASWKFDNDHVKLKFNGKTQDFAIVRDTDIVEVTSLLVKTCGAR